jgi:hypothetical protein
VGPESFGTTWRRENSWRYRDSYSDPSVVQPVASRYIDYAIPAPTFRYIMLSWANVFGIWSRYTQTQHFHHINNSFTLSCRLSYKQQGLSCEADNHTANDEIPQLSCNPNYRVHKKPPLGPFLSEITAFHNMTPIYFSPILILLSKQRSGVLLWFSTKKYVYI